MMRGKRRLLWPLLLTTAALLACVLDGGSVPHSHAAGQPGLYNQEHDLSYLATFGGAVPAPDGAVLAPLSVVALAVVLVPPRPALAPRRDADSRAPPLS
jgi:hypothetical protein